MKEISEVDGLTGSISGYTDNHRSKFELFQNPDLAKIPEVHTYIPTVCARNFHPIYIVNYYIKETV